MGWFKNITRKIRKFIHKVPTPVGGLSINDMKAVVRGVETGEQVVISPPPPEDAAVATTGDTGRVTTGGLSTMTIVILAIAGYFLFFKPGG